MELLCPAGSLPAVKSALNEGADAIYLGFKDDTNARHFAGLNFDGQKLQSAVKLIKQQQKKLHIAINTFAHPSRQEHWFQAVDRCAELEADAVIIADLGVLQYAKEHYPHMELHLSVQASATNVAAIQFYQEQFGVKRIVLPRVLSIHQVKQLARESNIELEVFAFGSLCIMTEGRCYLSSYLTGESPNTVGACSPAKFVNWQETEMGLETRLNNILLDRTPPIQQAGYPTLCKGRFELDGHCYHAMEEPTSLNTLSLLPELVSCGIKAVKIEGRQRSPAYVAQATKVWRAAIDSCLANPDRFTVKEEWDRALAAISEGSQTTLGAYHKEWK